MARTKKNNIKTKSKTTSRTKSKSKSKTRSNKKSIDKCSHNYLKNKYYALLKLRRM